MPVYKKYNGKPVVGYTASELGYTDPKLTEDENNPSKMFWSYQNADGSRGKPLGLQGVNDMLGLMGYKEASELRKKSFSERFAENITAGGGIGESFKKTFSEKSKARAMGIKESFDPLNIVKKLTGGSRLAPAILGRLSGRSAEDIKYFAGDPKKRKQISGGSQDLSGAIQTLGSIYTLMVEMEEEKKLIEEELFRKQKTEQELEDTRNKELIKALTGRRKTPKEKRKEEVKQKTEQRKEKVESKKEEKKKEKTEQKQEQTVRKKETEVKKEKTARKVEEVKKEEIKKPEVVKPKEVKPPPTAKPEAPPAVKPAEVKPPTAAKVPKPPAVKPPPTITGGDKTVMEMVKKHEGVRTKPYKDSLGLWTVGVGHLIGDGKTLPDEWKNRELSMKEVDELFAKDFQKHKEMAMKGPGWDKANETGQAALIDLTFNMGAWWKKFKNAAKALDAGDFNRAADELQYKDPATKEPSLWYQQVKNRAVTIVGMIRSGKKTKDDVQDTSMIGQKIDSVSTENKELKKNMADTAPAPTIVNNTSTTQVKKQSSIVPVAGDDRSAYAKKVN